MAMLVSGPLSDRYGRRRILRYAAGLYIVSAVLSAIAPSFVILVMARMLGGLGVGASLIIAPMYIAEISPAKDRGTMVSVNQLNIVLGISVAFFTNYLILKWGNSGSQWANRLLVDAYNWRWMLGIEVIPATLFYFFLLIVPESPRWLAMQGQRQRALSILMKVEGEEQAEKTLNALQKSLESAAYSKKHKYKELFKPALRLVLLVGVIIAIVQQITGINAVFFYAPMIFEQTGIGTDASFSQAVLVGVTNIVFTLIAMWLIDRVGRKKIIVIGLCGIALSMSVLAIGFGTATYSLSEEDITVLKQSIPSKNWYKVDGISYQSDVAFKRSMEDNFGRQMFKKHEQAFIVRSVHMRTWLILVGIIGFVASFAVSLGPVMWVLFSELFPGQVRGLAISFAGFINSLISFSVQLVFPWELANLGSSGTFAIYGFLAVVGLVLLLKYLPETKGKTLEELEELLIKHEA
jgi:MFS family permease